MDVYGIKITRIAAARRSRPCRDARVLLTCARDGIFPRPTGTRAYAEFGDAIVNKKSATYGVRFDDRHTAHHGPFGGGDAIPHVMRRPSVVDDQGARMH